MPDCHALAWVALAWVAPAWVALANHGRAGLADRALTLPGEVRPQGAAICRHTGNLSAITLPAMPTHSRWPVVSAVGWTMRFAFVRNPPRTDC